MNIIQEKETDHITFRITGRVDTITSPELQKEILNAFLKTSRLVLDFAQVDYVSSAGLRALLVGEKTAQGKGGSMLLIHVPETVQSVFEMTGFSKILKME